MLETKPLDFGHYDLVTPDGMITKIKKIDSKNLEAEIFIEKIFPAFVGFKIDKDKILFNIKSTLAQIGVDSTLEELVLDQENRCAQVRITIHAIGPLAEEMLQYITVGAFVGKLFAADDRRRVRNPEYISRMFGRADRWGRPLLSLGGLHGSNDLILDKVDGRTVAFLSLQNGRVLYDQSIHGFLPTLGKALVNNVRVRDILRMHQEWKPGALRNTEEDELLLVKTLPLHIRTVFAHVCNELLSQGYKHTSASILQPDTTASGDIPSLDLASKSSGSSIESPIHSPTSPGSTSSPSRPIPMLMRSNYESPNTSPRSPPVRLCYSRVTPASTSPRTGCQPGSITCSGECELCTDRKCEDTAMVVLRKP